jgi:hypothetical protein
MLTQIFNGLVVTKDVEALHRTCEDSLGYNVYLTEAKEVVNGETLVDPCIILHESSHISGIAD